MSHLLIVTVPASMNVTTMAAVRDYVAGSLPTGVLVLEDCMTWEVTDLPELGGTVVQGNQPDESGDCPGEDPPIDNKGTASHFSGPGAREKRRIYDKLQQYRADNGLGCLTVLSNVSGGKVTETELRDALGANQLPIEVWRRIDKALQAAGEP